MHKEMGAPVSLFLLEGNHAAENCVSDVAPTIDVCDKPPSSALGKRASAAWRRSLCDCDSAASHSSWMVLGMLTAPRISVEPGPMHVPRTGVLAQFAPPARSSVAFEGIHTTSILILMANSSGCSQTSMGHLLSVSILADEV